MKRIIKVFTLLNLVAETYNIHLTIEILGHKDKWRKSVLSEEKWYNVNERIQRSKNHLNQLERTDKKRRNITNTYNLQ